MKARFIAALLFAFSIVTAVWAQMPLGTGFSYLGNVAIGMSVPATTLDVNGTVRTTGLWLPTGAGTSKVLTSDSSGIATWQNAASGGLSLPYSGTADSSSVPAFAATNT